MFSVRITSNCRGVEHQLHGGVIHVEVVHFHFGVLGGQGAHLLAPEAGGFEHVGLIDQREVLAAANGGLESQVRDAADFVAAVHAVVVGPFAVGGAALVAEVQATGELAVDNQVGAPDAGRLQRRMGQQHVVGHHGADVGEQTQLLAQAQQALLGAHGGGGVVVVLRVADGSEQHGIGGAAGFQGFVGQGVAGGVDGAGPHQVRDEVEVVVEAFGHGFEHFHGLPAHFGSDAIAGQHGYFLAYHFVSQVQGRFNS